MNSIKSYEENQLIMFSIKTVILSKNAISKSDREFLTESKTESKKINSIKSYEENKIRISK